MKFDESYARLTEAFTGRTIEYIVRNGLELEFHTTCGHCIVLQADTNGDIHFKRQDVRIKLHGVNALGKFGAL